MIATKRSTLPITLGLAHGVSDGAAGLVLGGLALHMPLAQVGLLVLLYNGLAFGGQPLAGLLADRVGRPRAAALAGLLLGAIGLCLLRWPWAAVILLGVGSAAYHVGGGALALAAAPHKASGTGIFAAPGVLGLAAGGALAGAGYATAWPFVVGLLALAAAIAAQRAPLAQHPAGTTHDSQFDSHDLIMILLLAAIALRSAVWASFQLILDGDWQALMAVALAAAAGKVAGGYLADRLGLRRWTLVALLLAAPLLALGGQRIEALLLGAALLQSATPAALVLTARLLPGRPATACGLVFGLAVALGGVPLLFGLGPALGAPLVALAMTAAAAAVFWLAARRAAAEPA